MAYYITGDTHGQFKHIKTFLENSKITRDDVIIILGDSGINYSCYRMDASKKIIKINNLHPEYWLHDNLLKYLSKLNVTFFCIQGNHEARANLVKGYKEKLWNNGPVFYNPIAPNVMFAKDGAIYNINNKKVFVCGGAYSVDKEFRLRVKSGYKWFEEEQPDDEIKELCFTVLKNNKVDIILSHTCPHTYMPVEAFLPQIKQNQVDLSTEKFLQDIYNQYGKKIEKWYCGHFHIDKQIDNLEFLYHSIKLF